MRRGGGGGGGGDFMLNVRKFNLNYSISIINILNTGFLRRIFIGRREIYCYRNFSIVFGQNFRGGG